MPLKSNKTKYGSIAVAIHWLSALLVVIALGSGFRAAGSTDLDAKSDVLVIHASIGIAILLFTLSRIAWWWFADRKPDPVAGIPAWQDRSARVVHLLFYVFLLGMVGSGIGMFVLSGAGTIVFAGAEGQLPDFWDYPPRLPHGLGARLIIAFFVIHAGAALFHQFVRKDGLLKRMWF